MNNSNKIVLQAKNISKSFFDGNREIKVLNSIDLSVKNNEMLAIIGASGSGKSTLLHILGLLDDADSGELIIDGKNSKGLSETEKSILRNQSLGFVYQFHHLLAEFNALDNVAMPLIIRRENRKLARLAAAKILEQVGLKNRINHYPGQLSGGERQRVALARALVTQPKCILADEPTGNLDSDTASIMFELIQTINKDLNTAFIIVTHDLNLANLADQQVHMRDGEFV